MVLFFLKTEELEKKLLDEQLEGVAPHAFLQMPGSNSLTQPSAGCVELLVSPTCTGDGWDGADLPHSHPYLLLWFWLVASAVLINNICTVLRKWTFQFVCFHQPDAERMFCYASSEKCSQNCLSEPTVPKNTLDAKLYFTGNWTLLLS